MNRKEQKNRLLKEGLKHKEPLKFNEFTCPLCGGIATTGTVSLKTRVECHACGTRSETK